MEQQKFNTNEFWAHAISTIALKEPKAARSLEFLSDTLNAPPPGGLNQSDGFAADPYEQNNDLNGFNDGSGGVMGNPNGQQLMYDENGMPMDPSMAGGMMQPPPPVKPYKPTKNPFLRENGKAKLGQLLSDLYVAICESLESIQMNGSVDNSVVIELTHLSDSVMKIKKSLYLQPIESTLFKYKLCVKTYETIAQSIKQHIVED